MYRFIHEFPIKIPLNFIKILIIRFEMARHLYNAVLKEGFKRIGLMEQSKDYTKARKMKKSKERNDLFKKAKRKYKFSDYALQKFAIETKNRCDIKDHLDTHVCQKIATRVYNALNEYILKKRGRPRFKRKGWISSVEGKDNKAGIRFRKDCIMWKGLKLKILFDKKDKYQVQEHALNSQVKYVRLVKRKIKGKIRFFAQLILEGRPLIKKKNESKKEIVGLDIGPSKIAFVGKNIAYLRSFLENLKPLSKKIKKLQRKASKSLKMNNPDNYDKKGRIKRKKLIWKKPKRYKKIQNKISEAHRKLKESRKRCHNKLANKILSFGKFIKTEKLSYKSFQKNFGKSVNFRAPGMFVEILRRKAENAGGYVYEFSTTKTCLSQTCICGNKKKKKLSQRWHICECGVKAQRDLFSAYLSRYVENDVLNISSAFNDYFSGMQPFLEQAMLRIAQTAQGRVAPSSFGISQKSSSLVKDRSRLNKVKDVVGRNSRELLRV